MSTKTRRVTRRDGHEAVAAKQEFKYNESAHGTWLTGDLGYVGELNNDERAEVRAHTSQTIESYVVFSYSTPIAIWNRQNGWWTTERYFSRTTTTHQGFIRRGI